VADHQRRRRAGAEATGLRLLPPDWIRRSPSFLVGPTSGFAAGRYRPKGLFLIVPLCLLAAYAVLVEPRDPFVGNAIRAEAGSPYVLGAYLAVFLALLAPVPGLWVRRHERLA
jgi:hypothetical protein